MVQVINRWMSSGLCLTLVLQLALPIQWAAAGGNTTSADVMTLGSKNIGQGNLPTNTPEYLDSLCKRIKEATTGTVGPEQHASLTQKYELETACKDQGKLPDVAKSYCKLYEVAKTSQAKAYCEARTLAIEAKKGTDVAYKLDIAAAATCWAEYAATKAAESSGALGSVAKAASVAKGKICGAASMAASVAEVWTTIAMLKKKKGDKVKEDGTIKTASDFEKLGSTVLQMGASGIAALSGIQYGACLLFNKCKKYGGPDNSKSKGNSKDAKLTSQEQQTLAKKDALGELQKGANTGHTEGKVVGGKVPSTENVKTEIPVAHKEPTTVVKTEPVVKPAAQTQIDWNAIKGGGTNKFNGGANMLYGNGKGVDGIGGGKSNISFSGVLTQVAAEALQKKLTTAIVNPGLKDTSKVNEFNFNVKGNSTGANPSNTGQVGSNVSKQGSGDDLMDAKTEVMKKSAMTFTVLAGLRYLARNSAKKTQENAENLLSSMITHDPTVNTILPSKVGGGYKAGNGYVGGSTTVGSGDQSSLTGTPEDMLAPRGSSQRKAFDQIAAQIPDAMLDSNSGPGGISSAIGQVASAMGGDGQTVAAYADDGAARALAAMGMSDDIYATTGGGDGGSKGKSGDGLNLNLGAMDGEKENQAQQTDEMNFRGLASESCNGDIYHANCKAGKNVFEIVSDRYSHQPISKQGIQAF